MLAVTRIHGLASGDAFYKDMYRTVPFGHALHICMTIDLIRHPRGIPGHGLVGGLTLLRGNLALIECLFGTALAGTLGALGTLGGSRGRCRSVEGRLI